MQKRGKPTVTLCQSIFMELGRTEAKFFGFASLPLIEIPHHPSGGAKAGEHRADAEGAVDLVNAGLTRPLSNSPPLRGARIGVPSPVSGEGQDGGT
jgi:hypothetical protein